MALGQFYFDDNKWNPMFTYECLLCHCRFNSYARNVKYCEDCRKAVHKDLSKCKRDQEAKRLGKAFYYGV